MCKGSLRRQFSYDSFENRPKLARGFRRQAVVLGDEHMQRSALDSMTTRFSSTDCESSRSGTCMVASCGPVA